MISYLGFPITLPEGTPFGTICVLDNKRKDYTATDESLMIKLKNLIESHLSLIYMNQTLGNKNQKLSDYIQEIQVLRGIVPICANCKNIRDEKDQWHPIENYFLHSPHAQVTHGLCPECFKTLYPDMKK